MTIAVARGDGLSRRAFSVDDIARMIEAGILDEDERIELIEGELVTMAAKHAPHEALKTRLVRLLARTVPDHLDVAVEATLQLSDRVLVEPDLAILPATFIDRAAKGFLRPSAEELILVIEIADSSLRYDKGLKAALYARYGTRELWVIDAQTRVTWVHAGPRADGTWASIVEKRPDEALTSEALPGFEVRLAALG